MPAQSTSWTALKQQLSHYDQAALLRLIQELYQLNTDNKHFLAARLLQADPQLIVEPYRKAIQAELNPVRGVPGLNLRAARKAISDFKKACSDPVAVADLMLFYVEQGVICTNTYGDIDERFYDSMEAVYAEALNLISGSNQPALIEAFRPRVRRILYDNKMIGWGFHEGLTRIYEEEYPPVDE